MTPRPELSELDARVLRALYPSVSDRYLTSTQVAASLQINAGVVRSVLERLRASQLVEDDGSGRQRYARTRRGEQALEPTV